jgi:hypothetical protein
MMRAKADGSVDSRVNRLRQLVFRLLATSGFTVLSVQADTITDVTNIQAAARGALYIGNRAPLQPSPLMRLPQEAFSRKGGC